MGKLDIKFVWDEASTSGIGEASGNVWRRAYRREFERKKKEGKVEMEQDREVKLAWRVRVIGLARQVEVQWLRGRDQVLWESLCGLVHRTFRGVGSEEGVVMSSV
jgi:23S rRNA (adenine1618-N6)-methyltransferase